MAITRANLMTLEAYAKVRKSGKAEAIAHRRLRSVHLGEHMTLQFEDERTILRQIQEAHEHMNQLMVDAISVAQKVFDVGPADNDSRWSTWWGRIGECGQPFVNDNPDPVTVCLGNPASFTVGVTPFVAPVAYQWRKNGVDIPGATSSTYSIA